MLVSNPYLHRVHICVFISHVQARASLRPTVRKLKGNLYDKLRRDLAISSSSVIGVLSFIMFRQVNSQRSPLSPKSRADSPNDSKQDHCRYRANSNTSDLYRTKRRTSTYDLKLIRPDIEGRVGIQLAVLIDLDGIEEEVVDPIEHVSQLVYTPVMVGDYRTHPLSILGTFHVATRGWPASIFK